MIAGTAQPYDAVVVMLLGLAAAAVTGAAALRRIRGTSTPFAVPMALLALKLPTGALTAFLGLILLHGEFVPGLSALDSSGQILAWALLFGAAQQLVTGLVDKKAQSVLDSVGSDTDDGGQGVARADGLAGIVVAWGTENADSPAETIRDDPVSEPVEPFP